MFVTGAQIKFDRVNSLRYVLLWMQTMKKWPGEEIRPLPKNLFCLFALPTYKQQREIFKSELFQDVGSTHLNTEFQQKHIPSKMDTT